MIKVSAGFLRTESFRLKISLRLLSNLKDAAAKSSCFRMISFSIRKVLIQLIWLLLLAQLSWGGQSCEVSIVLHPAQGDTLKIPDKWIAWDKVKHVGVSAFFSGISFSIFRDFYNNKQESSIYFSSALTFSLGLGKEFYDLKTRQGRFSYKDLAADILGIGLGLLIAAR